MRLACVFSDQLDFQHDPLGALEETEAVAQRLETLGAAVEVDQAGEIFLGIDGLCGLYGDDPANVVRAVMRAAGEWRVGTGRTRFFAYLGASDWPRPIPIMALRRRLGVCEREADKLIEALKRLGIETLRAFSRLSAGQVADRFGPLGLHALRICCAEEGPLRPRIPQEELAVEIELPEGIAGRQLVNALKLLVDSLLAAPQRKGRALLGLRFGALLVNGGSWSVGQGLGRPTASAGVLCNVLGRRLGELPEPPTALRLRALGLGSPAVDQLDLLGASRRCRLQAAIREVRAAQGPEALLKIFSADSASRVPERRVLLTSYPES